ncbi:MAG: efflux transporter outer membrane subunit [Proteobacteria bacterium]|nr:MAG: efflux transporter outer membrane subunit [Pseudomonadota bacterium]
MNLIFVSLLLFMGACSYSPMYDRPLAPVPDTFSASEVPADAVTATGDWRAHFKDPGLQKVIEAALVHNRDLKVAALKVQEVRALYQIQLAERLPGVSANAGLIRGKSIDPFSGEGVTSSLYQGSVGLTVYELDFFGRVKSLSNAALERYQATEWALRSVQMSLIAETASLWIRELSLSEQEQLSLETLRSRENSLEIDRNRVKSGIANLLEMKTSQMLVETARASLLEVKREIELNRNSLRILVGDFNFRSEKSPLLVGDIRFPELNPGVSSTLLTRRPDILQSESLLKAANANIGAARAAFFPSISLTSSIGSVSTDLDGLFKANTEVWSFVPQINIPIFTGGRNRANLDAAKVRKEIAVIQYEQAIQNAFKEVKNSLMSHELIVQQVAAQKAVRDADAERAGIARVRYERGISGYLEYLEAQRSQFDSDRTYLRLNELRLNNDIALYRALGGSWR